MEPYIINRKSDWDKNKNLEILYMEKWKRGVKRLHVRDILSGPRPEFWLVYCQDQFLPISRLPVPMWQRVWLWMKQQIWTTTP